jgi:iron uptake system EfeUOB component EfeO/EfeM
LFSDIKSKVSKGKRQDINTDVGLYAFYFALKCMVSEETKFPYLEFVRQVQTWISNSNLSKMNMYLNDSSTFELSVKKEYMKAEMNLKSSMKA